MILFFKKIVTKVNEAQCFSVLADETINISTSEQVTLCVRYIDSKENLNEDFLKFIYILYFNMFIKIFIPPPP